MQTAKIIFVCHGNICRSPSAKFIFDYLAKAKGLDDRFEADSAATSTEGIGLGLDYRAAAELKRHGIPFSEHTPKQIDMDMYNKATVIAVMDENNMRNILPMLKHDPQKKIIKLLPHDIEDPWWTGNFAKVYDELYNGCEILLEEMAADLTLQQPIPYNNIV